MIKRLALASAGALCPRRFWSKVNARPWICPQIPWARLIEGEFLRDSCEQISDIGRCLCRSFKEEQSSFSSICFGIGSLDDTLIRIVVDYVYLVSCKRDDYVFVGLSLKFFDPRLSFI